MRRNDARAALCGRRKRQVADVVERRQARLVAEVLDLEGRGAAGKVEMLLPALLRINEVGIDVGAVEDVAGARGVDDLVRGDRYRVHGAHGAAFVVPKK